MDKIYYKVFQRYKILIKYMKARFSVALFQPVKLYFMIHMVIALDLLMFLGSLLKLQIFFYFSGQNSSQTQNFLVCVTNLFRPAIYNTQLPKIT